MGCGRCFQQLHMLGKDGCKFCGEVYESRDERLRKEITELKKELAEYKKVHNMHLHY